MNNNMKLSDLTPRERDIVKLLAEGHAYLKISQILCISHQAVKNYMTKVVKKLDIDAGRPGILVAKWVWEQEHDIYPEQ